MLQIGGASLRSPASESSGEDFREALAACSDHSDITARLQCTKRGVRREGVDDGTDPEPVPGDSPVTVVTKKGIHVFPEGPDSEPDGVVTVPLTDVEDARSKGVLRRELVVRTDEHRYRYRVDGRESLEELAQFCRRASWSWRRVAPRLETAREAVDRLETDLEAGEAGAVERATHRAKLALSKARSGADRLEVAVEPITDEIERLRTTLDELRVRWHVQAAREHEREGDRKRDQGLLPAAQSAYERARDSYQEALSVVHATGVGGANRIKTRLETVRERIYDLEVDPTVEATEAVRTAQSSEDPERCRDAWQRAQARYRDALDERGDEAVAYQLAWIDAKVVQTRRSYANDLEDRADEHAADGHDQWARQLYMAANDELLAARRVARARDGLATGPIDDHHRRLAEKAPRIDEE